MPSPDLVAACEAAPIPQPFTLAEFLRRIRRSRGRPLHVHRMPAEASGAVTGLWFATRKADHLFYAPGAAGVLLTNILLHEIAHMLLGHGDVGGDAERALRILVEPIVEAFEARRFKARARYDTLEEREAEKLATLLLVRASERRDDGDDEGLRMLSRTFGYER